MSNSACSTLPACSRCGGPGANQGLWSAAQRHNVQVCRGCLTDEERNLPLYHAGGTPLNSFNEMRQVPNAHGNAHLILPRL